MFSCKLEYRPRKTQREGETELKMEGRRRVDEREEED